MKHLILATTIGILLASCGNGNGRYQFHREDEKFYILDTKEGILIDGVVGSFEEENTSASSILFGKDDNSTGTPKEVWYTCLRKINAVTGTLSYTILDKELSEEEIDRMAKDKFSKK